MPSSDTQFKKGNQLGKVNGGRPKKPEWLKGKGEEALRYAYDVMQDENNRTELRMQAARMLVEYDLGKPQQSVDLSADIDATAKISTIEGMSLAKRKKALDAAIKVYESAKDQR